MSKKKLIPMDDYGMFVDSSEKVMADSLFVAQAFSKRHDNVLKDIRKLDCSDEFRLLNFEESTYANVQGKKQPCYYMTRDGFVFLVMGYCGKKAAKFKELYIKRFNEMEETLKNLLESRSEFPKLTDSIKRLHDEPKAYHFSNECDMLNRIALGMTAKQFRIAHGLEKKETIRPYLTAEQIELLNELQNADAVFLMMYPDFQERKEKLKLYAAKWQEQKRIEQIQEEMLSNEVVVTAE